MRALSILTLVGFCLVWTGCDSANSDPQGELLIVDVTPGDGERVGPGQTLKVLYTGQLQNGTQFDSTDERGTPWYFTMVTGQVLEGWLEGLDGMLVGGTRRLTIPPHLAFGSQGRCLTDGTCPIPPNATLIYDVTVLDILVEVEVEDVVEGTGLVADNGKLVAVGYTGTFVDGQVFDSSELSGQPIVFTLGVGTVIAGWDQGLVGMREGGIRNLIIPPHLAYGAAGRSSIPAYSTLKFRVEMVKVED
ncbi:MAG: FKBP-type peptidyl-prolyl cis-trans isomerase [Rhodothermales bacterium]|jgi:FKBP-type peptidyl-prolyl cis-trans isomerase